MSISAQQFIVDALIDLGCLFPGQIPTSDILNYGLRRINQMLDGWLIEELMIPASPAQIFNLTAGLQNYVIGPGQVAPNFDAERPTQIEIANIILNTVNPVLRTPLEIIDVEQKASIPVQDLPQTLPTRLYYERGFNVTDGSANIYIWGGAIDAYQLEIFTPDQSVLRQFTDLTTGYIYPPGYQNLIQKSLAVVLAPGMNVYARSPRSGIIAPSESMLQLVIKQADEARISVEGYNAEDPILTGDPAFLGNSARRGWNWLTGTNGRTGR